ncbi:MAG: metallophosphoesterase [Leptospiraceae bacterium]|nr:metallophosphoesterase [Leptospiraceae bacterium]MCK6381480.1 metallophosphoesterase [Leptospiraceae bacterium]NUM40195.1 metallophosphoesterase [Leptospiraceae bacterium]
MKIVYITDIHDGLQNLKQILLETSPDLYLLSGDIIYKAFFNPEKIIEFCSSQEELSIILKETQSDLTAYDFATRVIRFPEKYSEKVYNKSVEYRVLFNLAAKTMKEKYEIIEKLLNKYAKSPTWLLPGNYDIDLQYTALFERDLHRKTFEFEDIKFAGYGGAPITTSGIPEKLAVKFHEYNRNGSNYSEPEEFFMEELPDVVVIHNPAYGYLDTIPGFGHIGSQGIRRYLDEHSPLLVLSGHVHEDQGVLKKNKSIFLNPSNFGGVDSIYGYQEGGFFSEIILENRQVQSIKLNRLVSNKAVTLIEVDCTGDELKAAFVMENSEVPPENFIRK